MAKAKTTPVVEESTAKKTTKTADKKVAPKKTVAKKATAPKAKKEEVAKIEATTSETPKALPKAKEVKAIEEPKEVKKLEDKAHQSQPKADLPVTEADKPTTSQPANQSTTYNPTFDLKEMLETGAHFGHQARRWNPKMAPFIYAKRDDVHIFDLLITKKQLEEAVKVAYDLGRHGKTLIFVGTKRQAREIIKKEATEAGAMYIINRWLGGLISNWEQVSKSIKRMEEIRKGLETGKFKHYTKKERVMLDKEAQRLERFFGGISTLNKAPDALFVIDVGREEVGVKEASEHNIPIIAMIDSNDDPTPIDYPIPANDDAVRSIEYIVHAVAEAYKAGKSSKK